MPKLSPSPTPNNLLDRILSIIDRELGKLEKAKRLDIQQIKLLNDFVRTLLQFKKDSNAEAEEEANKIANLTDQQIEEMLKQESIQ